MIPVFLLTTLCTYLRTLSLSLSQTHTFTPSHSLTHTLVYKLTLYTRRCLSMRLTIWRRKVKDLKATFLPSASFLTSLCQFFHLVKKKTKCGQGQKRGERGDIWRKRERERRGKREREGGMKESIKYYLLFLSFKYSLGWSSTFSHVTKMYKCKLEPLLRWGIINKALTFKSFYHLSRVKMN